MRTLAVVTGAAVVVVGVLVYAGMLAVLAYVAAVDATDRESS